MGSNAIKVAAVVLVVLALVLVFVAYRYGQNLEASARQAHQQVAEQKHEKPKTMAVVAAKPLLADQKIGSGDVALVSVEVAPADHYDNVDQVVGRVPLMDIDAGTPLVPRLFTESNLLAHSIPKGDQALSLRVDDVVGAGGFVQPGDYVDVLVYLRQQNAGQQNKDLVQTQARVLLKNALVLAYEDRLVEPPKGVTKSQEDKQKQQQPHHERTAVLAVPDADTTRVMLGASLGELRLALRGQASPAAEASVAAPASVATVPVAEMTTTTKAGDKSAGDKTPPPDKVITLAELAGIKAIKAKPKVAPPPPVYVYRGDKAEGVRP